MFNRYHSDRRELGGRENIPHDVGARLQKCHFSYKYTSDLNFLYLENTQFLSRCYHFIFAAFIHHTLKTVVRKYCLILDGFVV